MEANEDRTVQAERMYRLTIPTIAEADPVGVAALVDAECASAGLIRKSGLIRTVAVLSPNETLVFAEFDASEAHRG
jgi:hypothetical protein